jgi:hypothetical protein
MHQVGYLPGISAGCTDNKTLKNPIDLLQDPSSPSPHFWLVVSFHQ